MPGGAHQDWQVLERLSGIRAAAATLSGRPVAFEAHQLLVDSTAGGALAAGVTRTINVGMPSDADFYWFTTSGRLPVVAADAESLAMAMIRFRIGQNQRRLGNHSRLLAQPANAAGATDGWIPLVTAAGQEPVGSRWAFPLFFQKGDFLGVDIHFPLPVRTHAALNLPQLTLHGYKARA